MEPLTFLMPSTCSNTERWPVPLCRWQPHWIIPRVFHFFVTCLLELLRDWVSLPATKTRLPAQVGDPINDWSISVHLLKQCTMQSIKKKPLSAGLNTCQDVSPNPLVFRLVHLVQLSSSTECVCVRGVWGGTSVCSMWSNGGGGFC